MPLFVHRKLDLKELRDTTTSFQLVYRSIKNTLGVIENVLIKVGNFIFPNGFRCFNHRIILECITNLWSINPIYKSSYHGFEACESIFRMDNEQEKFQVYTTVEKPSYEENSEKS